MYACIRDGVVAFRENPILFELIIQLIAGALATEIGFTIDLIDFILMMMKKKKKMKSQWQRSNEKRIKRELPWKLE